MLQRYCDAAARVATALLAVVCVLAMGAGHYWGRGLIQLTAAGLGIIWGLRLLAGHFPASPRRPRLGVVSGSAALVGLLVIPLIPLPPRVLEILSPRAFEIATRALPGWPSRPPFDDMRKTLDLQPSRLGLIRQLPLAGAWRPLALVPHDTALTLSIGVAYVLIAGVMAFYPWPSGGLSAVTAVLSSLMAVGLFEALYGLAEASAGYGRIYWFECPRPACMGTYVNKDHYAGLLEMIFPITLARLANWCAVVWRQAAAGSFRTRAYLDALSGTIGRLVSTAAMAILVLVGLAVSGSRSAFAATVGSLLVMVPLLPRMNVDSPRSPLAKGDRRGFFAPSKKMLGAAAVVALAVLWLTFPQIFGRVWEGEFARPAMAADTLDMVRDFPLFGIGLGNFASVFPFYRARTVEVWQFGVSNAHDDYLEWVVEVGVPAAALSFVLLVAFSRRVVRALRGAEHWTLEALTRWGLGAGVLALLLHSFTDFNLHIPANALVFSILVGGLMRMTREELGHFAVGSMNHGGNGAMPRLPDASIFNRNRRLICSAALLLCVGWATFVLRQWRAEATYRRVYPDLRLLDLAAPPVEPSGGEALFLARHAAGMAPDAPQFQAGLGEQLVARVLDPSTGSSELDGLFDAALVAYIRSLWAAPLQPHTMLGLVAAAEPIYEPDPGSEPGVLYDLVRRAAALAPYDRGFQLTVAEWYLNRWDNFTDSVCPEVGKRVEAALALAGQSAELRQRASATKERLSRLRMANTELFPDWPAPRVH